MSGHPGDGKAPSPFGVIAHLQLLLFFPPWGERQHAGESYDTESNSGPRGKIAFTGKFGPDATLYVAERTFLEGIRKCISPEAVEPFELGKNEFSLSLSWHNVAEVIEKIRDAKAY